MPNKYSGARRKQLLSLGIQTPDDLALWARRRGLLSVYLQYVDIVSPGVLQSNSYWQVVRPGYETDPSDTRHQGNKTFMSGNIGDRRLALQDALTWLSLTYGVDKWVSVAGLPNALFPIDTAKALRAECPSIVLSNVRGKLALSNNI